jgi:hypothetical protein
MNTTPLPSTPRLIFRLEKTKGQEKIFKEAGGWGDLICTGIKEKNYMNLLIRNYGSKKNKLKYLKW